jgi:hypothetical protein
MAIGWAQNLPELLATRFDLPGYRISEDGRLAPPADESRPLSAS